MDMKDARIIDLHARKLEADTLTGAEELELFSARIANDETGDLLRADQELHNQLRTLVRLRSTATLFAEHCHQRVVASSATRPAELDDNCIVPAVNTRVATSVVALKRQQGTGRWRGSYAGLLVAATLLAGIGLWLLWLNLRTPGEASMATKSVSPNLAVEETGTAPERAMDNPFAGIAMAAPDSSSDPRATDAPGSLQVATADEVPDLTPEMSQPEAVVVLGRLSESEGTRWTEPPQPLTSFPARYELADGTAAIELDDGATVVFQGPARLTVESPRRLSAQGGTYRIQTLDGREVSFTTPDVQIDQPGGGTFFLKTGGAEGTLVDLDAGDLVARPWSSKLARPISLSETKLSRGVFSPAWKEGSKSPAVAAAMGDDGGFEGVVEVAGRPLSVASPQVMSQVVHTATRRMREQPEQFPLLWQEMVGQLQGATGGQGSLSVNGQSQAIGSPEEWLEQMAKMRQRMSVPGNGNPASASSSSGFQGSLNINGVEQKFNSQEEFENAQREAFGPLFPDFFRFQPGDLPEVPGAPSRPSPGQPALPEMQGNSMSVFSGMINNNGNIQQFTRPEEFQRAMRQFNFGRQR
jgi:hypothetical protein